MVILLKRPLILSLNGLTKKEDFNKKTSTNLITFQKQSL